MSDIERVLAAVNETADAFGVSIGTIASHLKSGKPLRGASIDYLFE